MIQVLFSSQPRMAQGALKKVLHNSGATIGSLNFVTLNMRQATLNDVTNECESLPLGYNKKTVVAEDFFYLEKTRTKAKADPDAKEALIDYLGNPDPNIDLYILVYNDNIDEKGDIACAIKKGDGKFSQVASFTPEQWRQFAGNYFSKRGFEIEPYAITMILERTKGDYASFLNEAQKLTNYAKDEKITSAMVDSLVSAPLEDDAFHLSNALSRGDVKKALAIYKDLQVRSVEPISLIRLLATQFRFINSVYYLNSKHYGPAEISSTLRCSMGRANVTVDSLRKMNEESMNRALDQLYKCEYAIMSGKMSADLSFSLFLSNFSL